MGISPSTRTDIERTIKEVLTTFTTEYVKWTALYMVERAKKDAKATTWPYLLDQRPKSKVISHCILLKFRNQKKFLKPDG